VRRWAACIGFLRRWTLGADQHHQVTVWLERRTALEYDRGAKDVLDAGDVV
jgi:hypothetical protein